MKPNPIWLLACCLLLGAGLTACKGKTSAPAEQEPMAATAEGELTPVKLVRQVKPDPVEADTAAPADVGVVPEEAERSASGLAWVVLKEGAGEAHPAPGDVVVVNFIGWTAGGELIQESLTHGRPASISVGALFPGWSEGVRLMVEGEKRRFWIPGKLAFGEATPGEPPAKEGPPLGMLVYEIELLRFETPLPKSGDRQVSE